METKYIRLRDGTVAIFNESTGVEHWAMARDYFRDSEVTDAGFVYWQDGMFHVYGHSRSLGLTCSQSAAEDLSYALSEGTLKLRPFRDREELFYATTQPGKGKTVTHVSELYSSRVLAE